MSPKKRAVTTYLAMTPKLFYDPRYDLSWIYEVVESDQKISDRLFQVIFKDYDIFQWSKRGNCSTRSSSNGSELIDPTDVAIQPLNRS